MQIKRLCGNEDNRNCNGYCKLKEAVLPGVDTWDRFDTQIVCLNIFQSERNLTGNNSTKTWIEEGYAEKFAKLYTNGICPYELYEKIISK